MLKNKRDSQKGEGAKRKTLRLSAFPKTFAVVPMSDIAIVSRARDDRIAALRRSSRGPETFVSRARDDENLGHRNGNLCLGNAKAACAVPLKIKVGSIN